jgi:hypothetical protein
MNDADNDIHRVDPSLIKMISPYIMDELNKLDIGIKPEDEALRKLLDNNWYNALKEERLKMINTQDYPSPGRGLTQTLNPDYNFTFTKEEINPTVNFTYNNEEDNIINQKKPIEKLEIKFE